MPLITWESDELAHFMILSALPQNVGPTLLRRLESIVELVEGRLGNFWHVVPIGMGREGVEVQKAPGDPEGAIQGTLGVAHGVMIVQIAPKQFVL